jgi:hypothetical protein
LRGRTHGANIPAFIPGEEGARVEARTGRFRERRGAMGTNVSLTDAEMKLLQELLQGDLSRLLLEIAHTDHRSMREGLKAREEMLKGIAQKLQVQS